MLSPKEVGEKLGVSPRTVCRRCRDGSIPAHRIGGRWYVSPRVVERFFDPEGRGMGFTARPH